MKNFILLVTTTLIICFSNLSLAEIVVSPLLNPNDDATEIIQNAINEAANTHSGKVILKEGVYKINRIYFFHHDSKNEEFPTNPHFQGRITLEGDGFSDRSNFINDKPTGTVLKCTEKFGTCIHFGSGSIKDAKEGTKTCGLNNLSVWGDTSGKLVQITDCPKYSKISNVFIGNKGSGTALYIEDVWTSEFSNLEIEGSGEGIGINYHPVKGGLNLFKNITVGNFTSCIIFGVYSDADPELKWAKANTLINTQTRKCSKGLDLRYGLLSTVIINHWSEGNSESGEIFGIRVRGAKGVEMIGGKLNSPRGSNTRAALYIEKGKNIAIKGTVFNLSGDEPVAIRYSGNDTDNIIMENPIFLSKNQNAKGIMNDDSEVNNFSLKFADWDFIPINQRIVLQNGEDASGLGLIDVK